MRSFMVGAERYRFMYFHLESCGMSVLLWFIIVFLIWFWKVFVGSVLMVWKWFSGIKLCISSCNAEYRKNDYRISFISQLYFKASYTTDINFSSVSLHPPPKTIQSLDREAINSSGINGTFNQYMLQKHKRSSSDTQFTYFFGNMLSSFVLPCL